MGWYAIKPNNLNLSSMIFFSLKTKNSVDFTLKMNFKFRKQEKVIAETVMET